MSRFPIKQFLTWIAPLAIWGAGNAIAHPDPTMFAESAFVTAPQIVDCTLETGEQVQCYEIFVSYQPQDLTIGPFCPPSLAETGGLWDWDGDNAGLYRLDREFFEMVAELGYKFYDDDEALTIVDVRVDRPPEDRNACLSASVDESVLITMRLPVEPIMADKPTELGTVAKVGVALDGVPIFADAPSVLDRGHLPALDVCGGHIDPGGWYHWHATATDIETMLEAEGVVADCLLAQEPSALFGYAFDGFPIYGSLEADGSTPTDLDECGGHVSSIGTDKIYHYHAAVTFPNLPPCLVGVMAKSNFSTTAAQGIGAANARNESGGGAGPPDFEKAAASLGITAKELKDAIDNNGGREANLSVVAEQLGVDETALRNVFSKPAGK